MPNTVSCTFNVPNAPNGGKLSGGFTGPTPRLNNGDGLQIVINWTGPNPPAQLNGYVVISPAPSAPNQTTPSPFVNGSKFICYKAQAIPRDARGSTYTLPTFTYGGSRPGNYELTFVVEDATTTPPTQWSEDPEFDTGS